MKILLLTPPVSKLEVFVRGSKVAGSLNPPLGIAYIAAALERAGHKITIIDCIVENKTIDDIVKESEKYDAIGISCVTSYAKRMFETAEKIKNRYPKSVIFVGGPHPTVMPEQTIKSGFIDFAVIGEGEITSVELCDAIEKKKKDFSKIKGIGFMKGKKVVLTAPRPLIENLDELPLPARHLLPMDKYRATIARSKTGFARQIVSSRGCPFACTFCEKKVFGRKFRPHGPERVIQEIELLIKNYNAKEIEFWDDNFVVSKSRVLEICRLMKEHNINIPWNCEARADCVDREMLQAMAKSGCNLINYGVETGSERVLKLVNKGETKEIIKNTFAETKKAGIKTRGYFILGFVGETLQDMQETIDFAKELDPDVASFTFLTPFPGSVIYEQAKKSGTFNPLFWENEIVPEFNFLKKPIYTPEGVSVDDLVKMHKSAYKQFYFRPKIILKNMFGIKSVADLKRVFKGFLAVVKSG